MKTLDAHQIHDMIAPADLVEVLRGAFQKSFYVPERMVIDEPDGKGSMLLMPALAYAGYVGVKCITTRRENRIRGLPSIQGVYLLFDEDTGTPLLQLDAAVITNYRTAAASALAADYLAPEETRSMLMIGAGALAPYLIRAHRAVRPIEMAVIWSPSGSSAEQVASLVDEIDVIPVDKLDARMSTVDLISSATPSEQPLVLGELLRDGQHIDLVGGYTEAMRESDDAAIRRATVFVDDFDGALAEAGDLIQPIRKGILRKSEIAASLKELTSGEHRGRSSNDEITLFKSVGHALEDIATAVHLWEMS